MKSLIAAAIAASFLAAPAFADIPPKHGARPAVGSSHALPPGPCKGAVEEVSCHRAQGVTRADLTFTIEKCGARFEAVAWRPGLTDQMVPEQNWAVTQHAPKKGAMGGSTSYTGRGFSLTLHTDAAPGAEGQTSGTVVVGKAAPEAVLCTLKAERAGPHEKARRAQRKSR